MSGWGKEKVRWERAGDKQDLSEARAALHAGSMPSPASLNDPSSLSGRHVHPSIRVRPANHVGGAGQAWERRRPERPLDLPQAMLPRQRAVRLGRLVQAARGRRRSQGTHDFAVTPH
jgi:hypothetical protein